jgi:methionine-rich copper-binding protein CopC
MFRIAVRNQSTLLFLAILLLFGFGQSALSHAILLEAAPAVDSTVNGPDLSVKLRFNVRIDRSRSRLTLVSPDGQSAALVIKDEESPDSLSAQAKGLARGAYRLRWQVLASDGHITRGEIPFRVTNP